MKRAVAYIFLFIFSFQVLPIKEIGKILYKGLMTEERNELACEDDAEEGCVPKLKKEPDPFHNEPIFTALDRYSEAELPALSYHSEQIPIHHLPDITTPPPNRTHTTV